MLNHAKDVLGCTPISLTSAKPTADAPSKQRVGTIPRVKIASYWSRQSAIWIAVITGAAMSAEVLLEVLVSRRSFLLSK